MQESCPRTALRLGGLIWLNCPNVGPAVYEEAHIRMRIPSLGRLSLRPLTLFQSFPCRGIPDGFDRAVPQRDLRTKPRPPNSEPGRGFSLLPPSVGDLVT